MRTIQIKGILLLFCCIFISSAQGDDCDPVYVANQISALESKPEYKDCKLEDMMQSYFNSSRELIQILNLLKDTYKQSLSSIGDDTLIGAKMSEYSSELDKATTTLLAGNFIDITAANGIQQLRQWTKDVHSYSKGPKRRIDTIRHPPLSSTDRLTLCKANMQWKISQKWHQRIIHCINIATSANGDSDAGGGESTTEADVIGE
jgi:hypothetical protein